jgi:branched-chain amino acid transport system permease protein
MAIRLLARLRWLVCLLAGVDYRRLSIWLMILWSLQNGIVGFVLALFHVRKSARFIVGRPGPRQGCHRWRPFQWRQSRWRDLLMPERADAVWRPQGDQPNLRIKRGTIHGLIGPNGSGKSTMMNVLTGIYVPTASMVLRSLLGGAYSSVLHCRGIARIAPRRRAAVR